jgi:hypothetical protein
MKPDPYQKRLEQRIEGQDCMIADCPKNDPRYNQYVDKFIDLQIQYFNLTGDFYGRQKIVNRKV